MPVAWVGGSSPASLLQAAASKLIEGIGGRLHHLFFAFGKYDVVCLIEAPDEGQDSFLVKLEKQLADAPPEAPRLTAELLWLLYLPSLPSAQSGEVKRRQIRQIWSISGTALPEDAWAMGAVLDGGICHPGTGCNRHRPTRRRGCAGWPGTASSCRRERAGAVRTARSRRPVRESPARSSERARRPTGRTATPGK